MIYNIKDLNATEESNNRIDTEDNKFWMKLAYKKKSQVNIIEKIKQRLKILEISTCIIAVLFMIMTQIEYEIEYFPKFYSEDPNLKNEYKAHGMRILYSCLALLLSIHSLNLFSNT